MKVLQYTVWKFGPVGACWGPPEVLLIVQDLFYIHFHKGIVENFIVIQLIFAEKFESQDFTIRAAPGLSVPLNTCVMYI